MIWIPDVAQQDPCVAATALLVGKNEAAVAMEGPCFFLTECQILFVLLLE